jgi:hypothetical protein
MQMARDLNFLDDSNDTVLVPFVINGECEGVRALAQKVVILFFVNSEDALRYEGAGAYDDLDSANGGSDQEVRLLNLVNIYISDVETIIKADQETQTDLSDEETLDSIDVKSLTIPTPDTVNIELDVVSVAGTAYIELNNLEL